MAEKEVSVLKLLIGLQERANVLRPEKYAFGEWFWARAATELIRSEEMPSLPLLAMAGQCFDEVRNAN